MNISFWFRYDGFLVIETQGPQGKETFEFPYALLSIFKSAHDSTCTPLFNEEVLRRLSAESHGFNFHKNSPGAQVEPGNIPTKIWSEAQ